MSVRDASYAPGIKALRALTEMGANYGGTDRLHHGVMGMEFRGHDALYQRSVYISSAQTLIYLRHALRQKRAVEKDPAFGERLLGLIKQSPYKNRRRFAIDAMGWPEENGPQRLQNYLNGRVPDIELAAMMAEKLGVSVMALYGLPEDGSDSPSAVTDESLKDILLHLLSLEGIEPEKADTLASACLAAQRLLRVLPDEDPIATRAKYAARAAWHQRQSQAIRT